ncbi:MAG TPA: glycosyltransferase family 2 protein [Anaerolineales bacterium]|nr:glycosyltransferase family 2 protein [Anaerolineales bacterium]
MSAATGTADTEQRGKADVHARAGDFTVILCAYTEDRWEQLRSAVQSVQAQTTPPAEIILVVDHNPSLLERARAGLAGVRVLENQEAPGLSGARNSGIRATSSDFIAFMDEDAAAAPDWLAELQVGFQHPNVIAVGGWIEPVWHTERPGWFPEEFNWVVGCSYRGLPEKTSPVRNLIGANMAFRRGVFQAAGYFRNGIGRIGKVPVGCEETELCIRAQQRLPGSLLLLQPEARVWHLVPGNRATWRYFFARCYAEGLSKALVTRFVGARDGLSSEREYTWRTLPRGVWRGLVDGISQRAPSGFLRAFAILAGLATTTTGYVAGQFKNLRLKPWRAAPTPGLSDNLHD